MLTKLRRIAPEMVEVVHLRYELLSAVAAMAPVGRRALARHIEQTERIVRGETERLQALGLLKVSLDGMSLTAEGTALLEALREEFRVFFTDPLRDRLQSELRIPQVLVVPGDAATDATCARTLAREGGVLVARLLHNTMTVAVMGGSTMAGVAKQLRCAHDYPEALVLPARGALGEDLELQANTVAATLAGALGANYRLLHLPDDLPVEALPKQSQGRYHQWVQGLSGAELLLYGVGRADVMARRRGLSGTQFAELRQSGAVAEALGYYFDRRGEIVHAASALGVSLATLEAIPHRIACAGGADKAEALLAVARATHPTALVVDEAAAGAMCVLLNSGQ